MAATTNNRVVLGTWWGIGRAFYIAALVLFILSALVFNGNISNMNGHVLLAVGLALIAAAGIF